MSPHIPWGSSHKRCSATKDSTQTSRVSFSATLDGWMPSGCSYLLIKWERKRITSSVLTMAKIHCIVLICLHMIKKEAQRKSGNKKGSRRQSTEQNMGHQEDKLRWEKEIEKSMLHKRTNRVKTQREARG